MTALLAFVLAWHQDARHYCPEARPWVEGCAICWCAGDAARCAFSACWDHELDEDDMPAVEPEWIIGPTLEPGP